MALPQASKISAAAPEPPKHSTARIGVIVAIASLLTSLALIEVGLRVAGFSYRLYPEKIEFGWPNPTMLQDRYQPDNDLLWVPKDYGTRVAEMKISPPAIIFMGDSCTEFGTYDQFFNQHALEAGVPSFRSEKLGVGGWSSYQGLQQLRRDISEIKPKIVTVYFGWNDHWMGFGIEDRQIAHLRSPLFTVLEHSRLTQLAVKAALSWSGNTHKTIPIRVPIDDFRSNMKDIVESARSAGITPVLLTAPSSHRVGKEPEYLRNRHLKDLSKLVPLHRQYVDAVREVAAQTQAPLCDLFADFEALDDPALIKKYFNRDGIHLTKGPGEGYDKLAQFLVACFQRENLFERIVVSR